MTTDVRHSQAGSAGLHWALTSVVVAVAAGAVVAGVLRLQEVIGIVDDSPSTWSVLGAVSIGIVVGAATWRRVDASVVDLVYGVDDQQIAAIAAIDSDHAAELGAVHYLSELAVTSKALLRLPSFMFDIRPVAERQDLDHDRDSESSPWSTRLTATAGPVPLNPLLTRPVRVGADELGVIAIGGRVRGRGFSAEDVAAVDAIARHAAFAISNARHADAVRASRERAVAGIEEERRRLRRDLHDELGPNLAAMKLRLSALRRSGGLTTAGLQLVDELARTVDTTTAAMRRLVEDLRPPMLDDLGLADALRYLGFVPPELTLVVDSPGGLEDLPAAVQVALYRIGSEAIRNVVRHADATTCDVRLRRDDDAVTLTVIDDGCGIDDDRTAGVGLASMRERADELGGLVTVSAGVEGRGCCVAATLPLCPGSARSSTASQLESHR